MKIESIIKRKHGTKVVMHAPDRTYHFRPEEDSDTAPHVAEVDVENHALTFLRIPEGYRLAEGEELPEGVKAEDDDVLNGSTVHSASYLINGETVLLGELVSMAFDDSGLDTKQWNELSDEDRYGYIDATLKDLQGDANNPPPSPAGQLVVDATTPVPPVISGGTDNSGAGAGGEGAGANAGTNVIGKYDLDNTDKKTLAEDYEKRFGRAPSGRMSKADLAHALSEED